MSLKSHDDDYIKYKNKYLELKNNEPYIDNFYFVHNTLNLSNIKSMIKDGILYIGKYVAKSRRKHSGGEPMDYIYTNIYFDDLKNLSHFMDYSIILHPNIIHKYGAVFNRGWRVGPAKHYSTYFYKKDTPAVFNKKIHEIKQFIENPSTLTRLVREAPGLMHHEVLFKHNITLKDSLIGILCNWCPDDQVASLRKLLKKYGYGNVFIARINTPMSFEDLGLVSK